ncbi:MAG: hypothetical protein INF43_01770 [Alphaproteobacteria bacterium]|nr:hypothetical protein [Alphaproteobacteria bacterium]
MFRLLRNLKPQWVKWGLLVFFIFIAWFRAAPHSYSLVIYITDLAGMLLGAHVGAEVSRLLYPHCHKIPLGFPTVWMAGGLMAVAVLKIASLAGWQVWFNTGSVWNNLAFLLGCLGLMLVKADQQVADLIKLHQRYA